MDQMEMSDPQSTESRENALASLGRVAVHGYFVPDEPPAAHRNFGFADAMVTITRHWPLIATAGALLGAAALIWSLNARPVYRVATLVQVVESDDTSGALSAISGQFGGLAALTGMRLAGGAGRTETIAVLQSNGLAEEFIREYQLLPILFEERWNAARGRWRTDMPTMNQAVRRFTKNVRSVDEDRSSGLVKVSTRWHNPQTAAKWANDLVTLANQRIRQRAIQDASRSLEYLSAELGRVSNLELRQNIYQLMQTQLNTATLANTRLDYALKTIDSAVAPDASDYIWPRPTLLTVIAMGAGFTIGALLALLLQMVRRAQRLRGQPA